MKQGESLIFKKHIHLFQHSVAFLIKTSHFNLKLISYFIILLAAWPELPTVRTIDFSTVI